MTVQCDVNCFNPTKTTNISRGGLDAADYESVFREEILHVGSVIHSVYDTLHSQEVRRLHSGWLICCHGDRNDIEPNARQEKSGGLLNEWDKF